MATKSKLARIKLDERHHVEQPFLAQLDGLGRSALGLAGDVLEHAGEPHPVGKLEMLP